MADKNRDPHIAALEAVYAALKDLDAAGRKRVLSSAFALLEIEGLPASTQTHQVLHQPHPHQQPVQTRPVSLIELAQEKEPGTNVQRIALYAYYREKYENQHRFTRNDLEPYFAKAKQPPSSNYDRDFVEAVRRGWIHEDGAESYITSKGIEAVESAFEGERKYLKVRKNSNSVKRAKRKTVQAGKAGAKRKA
jgi:hypothetical protein